MGKAACKEKFMWARGGSRVRHQLAGETIYAKGHFYLANNGKSVTYPMYGLAVGEFGRGSNQRCESM